MKQAVGQSRKELENKGAEVKTLQNDAGGGAKSCEVKGGGGEKRNRHWFWRLLLEIRPPTLVANPYKASAGLVALLLSKGGSTILSWYARFVFVSFIVECLSYRRWAMALARSLPLLGLGLDLVVVEYHVDRSFWVLALIVSAHLLLVISSGLTEEDWLSLLGTSLLAGAMVIVEMVTPKIHNSADHLVFYLNTRFYLLLILGILVQLAYTAAYSVLALLEKPRGLRWSSLVLGVLSGVALLVSFKLCTTAIQDAELEIDSHIPDILMPRTPANWVPSDSSHWTKTLQEKPPAQHNGKSSYVPQPGQRSKRPHHRAHRVRSGRRGVTHSHKHRRHHAHPRHSRGHAKHSARL
ncbi:hypothetical protein NEHOM01_0127 [Nematocida homosporus]|uniref:uncharacterized protein n=1 Tax=Nematocida homosporus TaxID=1912981 RepID=UPI002220DCA5|nr:uncharacterized protein NEHOM01_0127 [Nematocida homosporus]KAI5184382.1 hypothetical protein NEHOM01_0127 [Nematocida homosporus]